MVTHIRVPDPLVFDSESVPRLDWLKWKWQFEQYAAAIQLDREPPQTQVQHFLDLIGQVGRDICERLPLSPSQRYDLNLIKEQFTQHFSEATNAVLQRFKFNRLIQGNYLTFEEFLHKLHVQSTLCEYGAARHDLIRDRIVAGVQCRVTQQRLLEEPGLTLLRAVEICRSREHLSAPRARSDRAYADRRAMRYARTLSDARRQFALYRTKKQPLASKSEPPVEVKAEASSVAVKLEPLDNQVDDVAFSTGAQIKEEIVTPDVYEPAVVVKTEPDHLETDAGLGEFIHMMSEELQVPL